MIDYVPYLFSKKDLINKFENDKQFDNWIYNSIKFKRIKKIRNGLYVSIDRQGNMNTNKFEIASKISDDSFISYHAGLEYYGIANQVFSELTIGSSTKFNTFIFDGETYSCKVIKNYEQVTYIPQSQVRVASLERTIIDCIDNINLAGGIEEVLNALDQIKFIDESKLLLVLKSYNRVLLYQKVGFILEQFKEELSLSEKFFEECQKHLTNQVKYFLEDEYDSISYNSKWKLMAPINLKSRLYGGQ